MDDKPIKAVFKELSSGGGISKSIKRDAIRARQSEEMEDQITVQRGYMDLEEFIEEFGEVDDFHNINLAIRAFLGIDQ